MSAPTLENVRGRVYEAVNRAIRSRSGQGLEPYDTLDLLRVLLDALLAERTAPVEAIPDGPQWLREALEREKGRSLTAAAVLDAKPGEGLVTAAQRVTEHLRDTLRGSVRYAEEVERLTSQRDEAVAEVARLRADQNTAAAARLRGTLASIQGLVTAALTPKPEGAKP